MDHPFPGDTSVPVLAHGLPPLYPLPDDSAMSAMSPRGIFNKTHLLSEAYCWRRSGFFWRMRASLGLACVLRRPALPRSFLAKAIRGPEPGAQVLKPLHLTPALGAPTGRPSTFSSVLLCLSLSFCLCCLEVTVTSLPPPRLCRIAVFSIKPPFSTISQCAYM